MYSVLLRQGDKCLMDIDKMDFEEANEYFSYNIQGSLGKGFPTYIGLI